MNTFLKPLDKILEMVEAVELNVTYEYDDLVFIENNPFLIRFDQDDAAKIYLHFNADCEAPEAEKLKKALILLAKAKDLILIPDSSYTMQTNEDTKEIKILFSNFLEIL